MDGGIKRIAVPASALAALFLPLPVFAFELGGYQLSGPMLTVMAEGVLFFVFLLFLYGIDAGFKGKLTLLIIYTMSLIVVWTLTARLPFHQNANLILSLHFGTPACIWIIGFMALKSANPYR